MKVSKVAAVGTLVLAVAACSPSAPAQKDVSGLRDDVKKVAAVKEVSHLEKKTKRVCTSKKKDGSCKTYSTVPDGTKKVIDKAAKPALYCVELDDVNGSGSDDDVWYTTTSVTYLKAVGLAEGDAMKFTPIHGGCW